MNFSDGYAKILEHVGAIAKQCGRDPNEITLIAISKTHSKEAIESVYQGGGRHFGESRLQEALPKIESCPKDITWHMVGPLQRNKVAKAVAAFDLIHSVADLSLAKKISEANTPTDILLQVNTSGELSKQGLGEQQWLEVFPELLTLPNLSIQGLMTIAPLTEDTSEIRSTFSKLRLFKEKLTQTYNLPLKHLSMGMTNDYPIAIEEGATLLRIGSAIFGLDE